MSTPVPLMHAYAQAGASSLVVNERQTGDALRPAAGALWLADLTPLPKTLIFGGEATALLAATALPRPALMRVAPRAAGGFVACRGPRQYLVGRGRDETALPAGPAALRFDGIDFALGGGSGGEGVDDLLAEACPTDLAQFDADAWVPTLLFGVDVALWRLVTGAEAHYRVIAAPADGEFLAETLLDAVRRRRGGLAGFNDYFSMQQEP
jgi:sarcosine oxidase gamma subunit